MDFYRLAVRPAKLKGEEVTPATVYPDFVVGRSKDLMVRGRGFYAVWDEAAGLWSTDEYDVQRIVDGEMDKYAEELRANTGEDHAVAHLRSFSSNGWTQFRKFMLNVSDNSTDLDSELTFANDEVTRADHVSKRLPYSLEPGDHSAWDELMSTLYSVEEREKIEWAIGAVVSGDSKKIQKFLVLYGPAGTGKSTVLNIIQSLFSGYTTTFEAKALGSSSGSFATEVFKSNPLVAIQHDGDLSRIEDNTRLNSIISHEEMTMNEKYKASYTARVIAFLFMGTNQPVRISDAKSGIIRRLIDVHPTGVKIPANHYNTLMSRIDFELGAIAHHCLSMYRAMGANYYNNYRPTEMMLQTDVFFNFVEWNFDIFKQQDGATLKQAYYLYKEFCNETGIERMMPQHKFREELRNYFDEFHEKIQIDHQIHRSYYRGFNANQFKIPVKDDIAYSLVLNETESLFDDQFSDCPAQLATKDETPRVKWDNCKTVLNGIDTSQTHFVRPGERHIVIDFDLRDESGEKSLDANLAAASNWPATYAELSKSGRGVHLHYDYEGDTALLSAEYSAGIEIKSFSGGSSLRRKLTKCNNVPIATLNSGLPLKEKKVLSQDTIASEKGLRDLIERNLRKEIHPGTKPSIDFIHHILTDAQATGMHYDVRDLQSRIIAFANNSSNQAEYCLRVVLDMPFSNGEGEVVSAMAEEVDKPEPVDERLVFFDVEVYPNLLVVCWKYAGEDNEVVTMVNPTAQEVEALFRFKLVGFNVRRYDNHILYGRSLGYDNAQIYRLSKKIIDKDHHAMFGEAYNLSYADIYDFSSVKQSLKKFQVDLGLKHQEMDLPWDESAPEDKWEEIVDYCSNDVLSTEAVFNARLGDFTAREILAELSGLSVNDTTQRHTAKIIFGSDRHPQSQFVYTDLSKEFPGYEFDRGKSTYRDEDPGEGGYVYAEPGMYENVAVLDIASMHPNSIIQLNLFGPFTSKFRDLLDARIAIKRGDYGTAREMLDGRLSPYLQETSVAKDLAYALKIVINTVYGLTAAKFENQFRDPRNRDNIVAKRGALFMIDLKHHVQDEMGLQVIHIKTDSIKVANATPEQIEEITNFGAKYGYEFEHESTYEKFCLVDKAQYIAREDGQWMPTGAQFAHSYVFKELFSQEPIEFRDYCEEKSVVQGAMYLDFAHNRPAFLPERMQFVGRTGLFVPVSESTGGGMLLRVKDDKSYAVAGTKGYLWLEADMAENMENLVVNTDYFDKLADSARAAIEKFGSFEEFVK